MPAETPVDSLYLDLRADYQSEIEAPFTDSLTGLFNYGFFLEVLKRELERSHRNSVPFTLLILDIDGFGLFNRHHGSVHGDRVLKDVG